MKLRILACAILTLSLGAVALADHISTHAAWRNITVSTSEEFYALGRSKEKKYPIHWMFDGRADTAWVFESDRKPSPDQYIPFPGRISLSVSIPEGFSVDGLRLMNGYNKSASLYKANSRIAEIEVSVRDGDGYKVIKRTGLKDEMGWRTVSLPKTKTHELFITVTKTIDGPIKDICISELELLSNGQPLNLTPSEIIATSNGDECGCGGQTRFIDRGYGFRRLVANEGLTYSFSPKGRRVVAWYDELVKDKWVGTMDLIDGRARRMTKVSIPRGFSVREVEWVSDASIRLRGWLNDKESSRVIRL